MTETSLEIHILNYFDNRGLIRAESVDNLDHPDGVTLILFPMNFADSFTHNNLFIKKPDLAIYFFSSSKVFCSKTVSISIDTLTIYGLTIKNVFECIMYQGYFIKIV